MNTLFWILQTLLALHTAIGAIWKFSHSAGQTMPALKAIPHTVWQGMGFIELLCALALIIPVFHKSLAILTPVAAIVIAVEMLLFTGLHVYSGNANHGPIIYWLVVAAICSFIAYGRLVLKPF